ncbi:GNAT family N-acetyltransferase [Kiloniella antarctica]|uniref:GNAT family N-acetyltransferase n=1 Tax=Kiloniella antarctica TaxID=1550907 RepID=A0ABW5BRV7_9PROT
MVEIRKEEVKDRAQVLQLIHDVFGRWDESDLVKQLYLDDDVIFGLVAEEEGRIVGHVLFSKLEISTDQLVLETAALAPIAVHPDQQKQGIGAALINESLLICRNNEELSGIIVLGNPDYYQRFGFSSKLGARLDTPFKTESFMALEFRSGILPKQAKVKYPSAFGL